MNTTQPFDKISQIVSNTNTETDPNTFNVYIKHRALNTSEAAKNYLFKLYNFVEACPGEVSLVGTHAFDTYTYYTIKVSYGNYTGIKERSVQSIRGFNATKMLVNNFTEYYPVLAPEPSEAEKDLAFRLVETLQESHTTMNETHDRVLQAV